MLDNRVCWQLFSWFQGSWVLPLIGCKRPTLLLTLFVHAFPMCSFIPACWLFTCRTDFLYSWSRNRFFHIVTPASSDDSMVLLLCHRDWLSCRITCTQPRVWLEFSNLFPFGDTTVTASCVSWSWCRQMLCIPLLALRMLLESCLQNWSGRGGWLRWTTRLD